MKECQNSRAGEVVKRWLEERSRVQVQLEHYLTICSRAWVKQSTSSYWCRTFVFVLSFPFQLRIPKRNSTVRRTEFSVENNTVHLNSAILENAAYESRNISLQFQVLILVTAHPLHLKVLLWWKQDETTHTIPMCNILKLTFEPTWQTRVTFLDEAPQPINHDESRMGDIAICDFTCRTQSKEKRWNRNIYRSGLCFGGCSSTRCFVTW